ncbi:39S ribosomal protein L44, mitochondrial [Coemansia sp. RSA 485]|nr:39S ribosomal protein L44, mitochondrial [Coemansia sp. RSA 485]
MLKQITGVRVAFCPFSNTSTSSKCVSAANPMCQIDVVTTAFAKDPSSIAVTFKDGKKMQINGADMNGDDIITQVEKYSKKLSQKEDLQGQ